MAKVYLEATDTGYGVVNSNVTVYGASGTQKVTVNSAAKNIIVDQNIESVVFAGDSSSFMFKQSTNKTIVYAADGTTVVATVPTQGDTDGTVLTFSDGSLAAKLSGSTMNLGGGTIGSTISHIGATHLTGLDSTIKSVFQSTSGNQTVSVTNTGSHTDTATVNTTYNITAGTNYTYTISGFGSGDKLIFPAGQIPSVAQDTWNDGIVDLTYASNGTTTTIHLIGLTTAQDTSLNAVTDFNTVFGAGTLA